MMECPVGLVPTSAFFLKEAMEGLEQKSDLI